jgi:hypothetical protein
LGCPLLLLGEQLSWRRAGGKAENEDKKKESFHISQHLVIVEVL